MQIKGKLAKQKKAAKEIAEIMYASLQRFPKREQERRIRDIRKITLKIGRKRSGKASKPVSTQASPRVSRRAATARQTPAHP